MNYNDDAKKTKSGGIASALGAAAVGVAVGAAAAYLSDKNKRDNLMKKATDVSSQAKGKASDLLTTAADKTGDALQEAGKKVKNTKPSSDKPWDDVASSVDDMTTI